MVMIFVIWILQLHYTFGWFLFQDFAIFMLYTAIDDVYFSARIETFQMI